MLVMPHLTSSARLDFQDLGLANNSSSESQYDLDLAKISSSESLAIFRSSEPLWFGSCYFYSSSEYYELPLSHKDKCRCDSIIGTVIYHYFRTVLSNVQFGGR